jgi:LDH2 family malate/lactate/ureidoglycolate dehydrogenase
MAEDSFRVVESCKLRDCVAGIFRWKGMPDADANIAADTAVDADLRGVHSHGVLRVDPYLALIDKGEFVAKPNIRIVRDLGPRAVVDGDGGMGQVSGYRAMELAIQRTREHGIASVSLRNGRHIGAAAYYSMMASAQGMIGVTVTNAGINMVPTGGTTKLVGNNPLAIAVPTNREFPMVLDVATSVAAGGKLDVAISKGEKIPLGWALDPDGVPTDDPVIAREGSLLPVGGHKGYGLAVMLDVLAGVLSGGRFGSFLGADGSSQLFIAIEIEGLMPLSEFKSRMDELIDQLHSDEPAKVGGRIYVPGEIEWELSRDRLENGIPLPISVVEMLEGYASAGGVDSRPSRW